MPLRLKSIELQGYKTFATRTLFQFSAGITAIVGPNGSGKSNIADAIRWVLGEQSYLLLRGKKTEDMIFSGSELRPRGGMAQATVTFDNTDNWLPLEYSEVELARHAFRDGRNEYLLNGHHVRLRDINEILSQAGLSERTYTILGQGLVDASLALKADERRRLFEEAAGVGLYRARREEALKRLDGTNRNLERVLDILAELGPRVRSLERQARRAIEYAGAQADLKMVLRDWYGYHWHRAQKDLLHAREAVRIQGRARVEAVEAHEAAKSALTSFRERLSGLRGELNSWHRQASELQAKYAGVLQDLAVLEERRRALTATRESILRDQARTAEDELLSEERLNDAAQEAARLRSELQHAQEQLAAARVTLGNRQDQRASLDAQVVELRSQLELVHAERAEVRAKLDELADRLVAYEQRAQHVGEALENAQVAVERKEVSTTRATEDQVQAAAILKDLNERIARSRAELDAAEAARRVSADDFAKQEAERSRMAAQLDILEQAERSFAGFGEGARFLLEAARTSRLQGIRGALSAAIDVPAELETAIAAALGDSLDAVLLERGELEKALLLLETHRAGRAAMMPLDGAVPLVARKPSDPRCIGVASELVQVAGDLRASVDALLGQTIVVGDRSAAWALLTDMPASWRIVTLKGEIFRGDGLVVAGQAAESVNLSRPRKKRELQDRLSQLVSRLSALEADLSASGARISRDQVELDSLNDAAAQAARRLAEAESVKQRVLLELETSHRHLDWEREQLGQLRAEEEQAKTAQNELLKRQATMTATESDLRAQIASLAEQLDEAGLDELQAQVSYWTARTAVAEEGLSRGIGAKDERSEESVRLESRKAELDQRLLDVDSGLTSVSEEGEGLKRQKEDLSNQLSILQARLDPAQRDLDLAEQEESHLADVEATQQRGLSNAERSLSQLQLDLARRDDMLNGLREKITDDFGLVMFDYAAEVSGPVPLPFEGLIQDLPTLEELPADLEEQLTRQRARLRRMGAINPEAREEFERERERHDFLKAQVEDLHRAQADLHKVLTELDELTRRDFARTFEAVDKEFRQIFVRLFGGGSARLALTDPANLVETGIEIEARLPGRREQGLALLSGGERSLTAIALVFALLKVSPTPVCVMDEVDAMLDEANVGRFRDLLAELSRETQFIIITHNRNTVQAADVIYGVTMGRDSASQVISLKLDEVTDEVLK